MKILCKYLGGSHLYGMNTPESDIDERGVYLNTNPLEIYGFTRNDNVVKQDATQDILLHELTQFLRLVCKSNTQSLECLFAPIDSFAILDTKFRYLVLNERGRFLDSSSLFKSLKGYLFNEMRLAIGERTGQLGSKRKNALDKYGFSPKNFVHLIRLAECGAEFFRSGIYPVKLNEFNSEAFDLCMSIKLNPENFEKEELIAYAEQSKEKLHKAYESRTKDYTPDLEYVGYVLQQFYK